MMRARTPRLAVPLGLSLALHVSAFLALLFAHGSSGDLQQLPYSVKLTAAPVGRRDEGLAAKPPAKDPPKTQEPKSAAARAETPKVAKVPTDKNKTVSKPVQQTATVERVKSAIANAADPVVTKSKVPVPAIAGSSNGGRGADVADVLFHGLEFPNERYLKNIVSRIARNFEPPANARLVAEVTFDINRDGCMSKLKVVKGSGFTDFDLEAQVAIGKASENCGFSPLPPEWTDEILSIRFRFDPKIIKP